MSQVSHAFAKVLADENSFATTLTVLLVDTYGTEYTEWDPATVGTSVKQDFGVAITEGIADRIQAGATLLTTDLFFRQLEAYIPTCNALFMLPVLPDTFLPAPLEACAWGCVEARFLLGDLYEASFSGHIPEYVGKLLDNHGIWFAPEMLAFAEYPSEGRIDDPLPGPEDLQAIQLQLQSEKKTALEQEARERFQVLVGQLQALPLQNASAEVLKARSRKA